MSSRPVNGARIMHVGPTTQIHTGIPEGYASMCILHTRLHTGTRDGCVDRPFTHAKISTNFDRVHCRFSKTCPATRCLCVALIMCERVSCTVFSFLTLPSLSKLCPAHDRLSFVTYVCLKRFAQNCSVNRIATHRRYTRPANYSYLIFLQPQPCTVDRFPVSSSGR